MKLVGVLLMLVLRSVSKEVCSSVYSCLDCNTTRICRADVKGGFVQIETVSCPAETPYCDYSTGTCTHSPDKSCGEEDSFVCLEDGFYPDTDCKVYHVCDQMESYKFQCTNDEVYNAEKKACERNLKCGTFECKTGQKVSHSEYPSYYAFCKSGFSTLIVDRCPGYYEMNETSQNCDATCHREGVQENVDDCTKYFKCESVWIEGSVFLRKILKFCPPNTAFDKNSFICVDFQNHPDPECAGTFSTSFSDFTTDYKTTNINITTPSPDPWTYPMTTTK